MTTHTALSSITFFSDDLKGKEVINKVTSIGLLKDVFADEKSRAAIDQDKLVYEVQAYLPVQEGTLGGLYLGITKIHPGKVADEYFMTRGHFHELSDRAEYYWGIKGEGYLILMDRDRNTRMEKMTEGSLHYIQAHTAHRVVNTGNSILSFGACWPSDAGHDYKEIADHGFSARLMDQNGNPELVVV
ncbi:glucose-6-phosphate isomerase [Pedobacter psychrophilus]|uniref:glucose-6-phosphate isomerase n=1 Tax=Pedobacter psychrophilus TaxID=1826909 RepID=A0A179DHR5_9SPHI|nr:glucose-6-phosphate isomerase family protein [Pedobacter psychrophilus]OAQ40342.1 glucose-6-phosphate isomerase [Pedobacter psychrophilus]